MRRLYRKKKTELRRLRIKLMLLCRLQGTNFQFAADNIVADWHDNTNYNSWLMGDTAPSAAGYYYLPSTNSISQAYKDFLSALEPVGYQQNQDYVTARSTLNNLIQVQISKVSQQIGGRGIVLNYQKWM